MAAPLQELIAEMGVLGPILENCPADNLCKFANQCIESLCGHGPVMYSTVDDIWDLLQFWTAKDKIQSLCINCIQRGLGQEQMLQCLVSIKNESKRSALAKLILLRQEHIQQACLGNTLMISEKSLSDLNWQLRLALSSDQLANLDEPLALVTFHVKNEASKSTDPKTIEMGKNEIDKFVETLEEAHQAIHDLTA